MGRPPSNGGPSFRFNQAEISEMEAILQAHNVAMPAREVLVSLAEKFSNSEERKGKIEVQMKQVWNWFQNRRYAIRAKAAKSPGKLNITQMTRDDSGTVKGVPQATQPHVASSTTIRCLPQGPQHPTVPSAAVRTFPQAPQHPAAFTVQSAGRVADNSQMEYEAKSARDGAWYDVSTFLSHRSLETGDPEVLVRFAGFGAEEDEWVNVRKNVRQRSLPCESSECVAVLPADLILCFQEGKEQALYFDAHVLDAQRRRHDVRGCRCRFLVRYDHDQSEEIVALRKICRRPETDYRLQQLHAVNESLSANHNKNGGNNIHTVSTLRVYPPAEVQPQKHHKVEPVVSSPPVELPQKRQKVDSVGPAPQPEGSQPQFKVEPVVLAPQSDVSQHQAPEVSQYQHKVETMLPEPSAQQSVEPQKVESMVPVPSAQGSVELQSIEVITATRSDEVPLDSVKPNTLTNILVEPHTETVIPSSDEAKQAVVPLIESSQEHRKAQSAEVPEQAVGPTVHPSPEVTPTVAAPLEIPEEPVVLGSSSVKVPTALHDVQPSVPDKLALEAIETKAKEPLVPVFTTDPNVAAEEATENKAEESVGPVLTSDPNVAEEATETKAKEPVAPVSTSDPSVVEEAVKTKTDEPPVPVSTSDFDVAEEAMDTKTEEPVVAVSTSDPNAVEEIKSDEPVVAVSTSGINVVEAMETKTEEPMVDVTNSDPNVVEDEEIEETKAAEPILVPVSTSDAIMDIKTEAGEHGETKIQQPRLSETVDGGDGIVKEEKHGNIAESGDDMEEG